MNFFRGLADGTAYSDVADDRKNALTAEVGDQKVDTCHVFDTGRWETGIKRDTWYIVEEYDTEDEAKVGHAKWVADLTATPDMELVDAGFANW